MALSAFDRPAVENVLRDIQRELYEQAVRFLKEHTHETEHFAELKDLMEKDGGFVWAPWDGTLETANRVKDELKATIRIIGDAEKVRGKKDPLSGKPAREHALYAKAY